MKLHSLIIAEEAIEVRPASDLWQELKDQAKTYISSQTYLVRKIKDEDAFEVLKVMPNNSRVAFAKLKKLALDTSFAPLRARQVPDAEGFVTYRGTTETQAIKYDGDTIQLDLDGAGTAMTKLVKGDYLIQKASEKDFTYTVQKARTFEDAFTPK